MFLEVGFEGLPVQPRRKGRQGHRGRQHEAWSQGPLRQKDKYWAEQALSSAPQNTLS